MGEDARIRDGFVARPVVKELTVTRRSRNKSTPPLMVPAIEVLSKIESIERKEVYREQEMRGGFTSIRRLVSHRTWMGVLAFAVMTAILIWLLITVAVLRSRLELLEHLSLPEEARQTAEGRLP